MTLQADDFASFFTAVHGHTPFPWQTRLVRRVLDGEGWPDCLDLPTGAGKTSTLDVAVFALAADAARPPARRRMPRRVVFVVDRRVIVDQTAAHAAKLEDALACATHGVLADMASALRSLSGTTTPLRVAVLRGGMVRDNSWALTPTQPLIAVSTVDQVGSRLLFRGYGLSTKMAPIHAGLLGNDALLLLDEVHLSAPFEQTLHAIARYHRTPRDSGLPDRWSVVAMSATPTAASDVFGLNADDLNHRLLRRRLAAGRVAAPLLVPTRAARKGEPATAALAQIARVAADEALHLINAGATRVGVILNRVDSARAAWEGLCAHAADRKFDVALLTGRMRSLDKDKVAQSIAACRAESPARSALLRPVVVVSTQCIETGADLDFDAMVSECAALDALRQRFGRVNRMGHDDAGSKPASVVLMRKDQVGGDDPIYGEALAATWAFLVGHKTVDFGITALDERLSLVESLAPMLSPRPNAPVLLPGHVDLWVQTHPRPWPDPDVSLWLHGPARGEAEVQLVWRADLSQEALADQRRHGDILAKLDACPPSSLETLSLPRWAAERWLAGLDASNSRGDNAAAEVADVLGGVAPERDRNAISAPVVVWRGAESEVLAVGDRLRGGDTYIIPATYGGINAAGCWAPADTAAVIDLGDRASWTHRGMARFRWDATVITGWRGPDIPTLDHDVLDRRAIDAEVRRWLGAVVDSDCAAWAKAAAAWLRSKGFRLLHGAEGDVLIARRRRDRTGASAGLVLNDDGDQGSSFIGAGIELDRHNIGVGAAAAFFAERAGLPAVLVDDLRLAGSVHDVGKADPRFQRMLQGGAGAAGSGSSANMLAKSPIDMRDREARVQAQKKAGYPKGCRHELMSLALIDSDATFRDQAHDWDLVCHLVASHHGWCRPFAPAISDDSPVQVAVQHLGHTFAASSNHELAALDSDVAERFWRLNERYGCYGLAWLEAILRLADHRVSELSVEVGHE